MRRTLTAPLSHMPCSANDMICHICLLRRPYKFKVVYSVHLHGEDLHTDMRVINEDDKPFSFTGALHSYFEVLDIGAAKVYGLENLTYLDKVS